MENLALKDRLSGQINNQQSEVENNVIPISTSTEVSTISSSGFVALSSNALDVIGENLKNTKLTPGLFDIIKAPSGGTTAFTVPGIGGDEIVPSISGIILDYATPRAFWSTPDPVEGTPPECYSPNSLVSHDGKNCAQCPHNEYGTNDNGNGSGKACKESVSVFILQEGKVLPIIVRVPVSSKNSYMRYMTRLVSNMMPVTGVVTKITLTKTTNKTGQPYALYGFEAVRLLNSDEAVAAKAFGNKFSELIDTTVIDTELAEDSQ
jgi:hypothetical protein